MSPLHALRPCSYPGCTALVSTGGRCAAHVRTQAEVEYRRWYQTDEWRRIRKDQLIKQPWCEDHLAGGEYVIATDVDHVRPHRGDRAVFMGGPFKSLCHSCHSKKTMREVMQ